METVSFGEWVRRRRLSLDLTQAELADRVACASITVRKIEADERRPSKVMAECLAEALELDDESRDRFVAAARAVTSPVRLGSPIAEAAFGPGGDLPAPMNPLLGREREVADLLDLLHVSGGPARLVTIVGPPGVGKTRLAIEVAARAERKFDVPALYVDLSMVTDPADVPARIAESVSTPAAALVDVMTLAIHALRRAPALVVLDNFEHVVAAADEVLRLVESCPEVVCLVTSRAALDLYGEQRFSLEPLSLAVGSGLDSPDDDLGGMPPAEALFVARAREVERTFDARAHAADVAEICRLVDGLPLAIELAARRVQDVGTAALAGQLAADGQVLGAVRRGRSDRERSAEGAIAWSFGLLSGSAQEVLLRSSVFPAGFDAASIAVLAEGGAPFDGLGNVDAVAGALDELVAQALLRAGGDVAAAGRRFDALMVVREFGRRRLETQGRLDELRSRHATLTVSRIEAVSPGIEAWPEPCVIEAMTALDPDVRAALGWAFGSGRDPASGRRLAAAVLTLWHFRGQAADSVRWSEVAYRSLPPDETGRARYQAAYYLAASLWAAGELEGADGYIDEAIAGAEGADDPTWLAETVGMKQLLALSAGDLEAAGALASRCVRTAEAAGSEWLVMAHLRAARLSLFAGDLDAADVHVATLDRLCEEFPSTWSRANAAGAAGDLALAHGDPVTAVDRYLDAIGEFSAMEAVVYAIARISSLANALVVGGAPVPAAALYGLVDEWCDELGAPLHPMAVLAHARFRAQADQELGEAFGAAMDAGRELPRTAEALRSAVETALVGEGSVREGSVREGSVRKGSVREGS